MAALAAVVAAVLAGGLAPPPAAAARPDTPTWSDEFTGIALDRTKWGPRATGDRHDGILTPDAVSVGGDVLTITTYTENDEHYSGMISTQAGSVGFLQRYGYFEARMKFNSAPGQWSAFWLQSPTIGNPLGDPATAGVEMDVVEHRVRCVNAPAPTPPQTCGPTSSVADRVQQGLIWDGYGSQSQAAIKLSDPLPGLGNGSWHTWALNWTPDRLTFYFDDREIWSRTGPISQRSQYIILSSEVGAFFAGAIPPLGYGTRATSTTKVEVDWVRAWDTPAAAPANTAAPVASGVAEVGSALACTAGTWSGTPAPTLAYQWLSDGAAIAGASASAYTVQSGDRGHGLACRVDATNLAGTTSAPSNRIAIPAPPAPAPTPFVPFTPSSPPPPPPPPPAPIDRLAPNATVLGATSQRLGRTVSVKVLCRDEPCRASVTGTVRVPRIGRAQARTYKPRAVAAIARGATLAVRLNLSTAARAAIRRALRSHRRITVQLAVRVTDGAGNAVNLSRRVALRLPPSG